MPKNLAPTVIKKYPNRRLYNMATSVYVTLDDVCTMLKNGEDVLVQDAKTGEDLTRSVLTQIILEQDSKGENLLPVSFLKQLIGFYDDQMKHVLPSYLDHSLQQFQANQHQIESYLKESLAPTLGVPVTASWEDMAKRNVALAEQTMRNMTQMFFPFKIFAKPDNKKAS